jgi:hypothetical protein
MTWDASTTTLSEAVRNTDLQALSLKTDLIRVRALITSSAQSRRAIHTLISRIQTAIDVWDEAASVPGIQAFVREQKNNPTLDVAAAFASMRDPAVALQAAIYNVFPRDAGTGAVLMQIDTPQGQIVDLTFTVAQMAGFLSLIDAYTSAVT